MVIINRMGETLEGDTYVCVLNGRIVSWVYIYPQTH